MMLFLVLLYFGCLCLLYGLLFLDKTYTVDRQFSTDAFDCLLVIGCRDLFFLDFDEGKS
jgi:hypothetical protein